MTKLTKLKKLIHAYEILQATAEELREIHDEKRSWWDDKSEKYQESEKGQEWDDHLLAVEGFLDDIENIVMPDFEV